MPLFAEPCSSFDISHPGNVKLIATGLEHACFLVETGLGLEVIGKICMHLFWGTTEESGHRSLVFEKTDGSVSVHHPNGRYR